MKKLYPFIFILAGLFIVACGGDEEEEMPVTPTCDTEDLTYTNDIAAIINF